MTKPPSQPRSLLSYLVLPRPSDTVKWIILPVGFLVGGAVGGWPSRETWLDAAVVWLALELLVYQARYQWNDIRGFEADQRHPGGDRGRLPGPLSRRRSRVASSGAVAVVKVVAAVGLCLLASPATAVAMLLLTAAVFALAAVYEALRAVSTGRTGQVPPPLTPGIAAIWVVIGAGYALRAVTGLALAVDLGGRQLLLGCAVATCWCFGTAWITSRWCVEATAFARQEGGELLWRASPDHAREHQLALVRWLPRSAPPGAADLSDWAATRPPAPASAPWALAGTLAAGFAGVGGALLADPDTPWNTIVACAALGAVMGATLLAAGSRRELATALAIPAVAGSYLLLGVADPLRATLPWLVVAVGQASYLRQDRASMGRFLRGLPGRLPSYRGDQRPATRTEETPTWISTS